MLLRAESRADPELYCAALQYAMLLTVNTHAHHYIEKMYIFNIERFCMSEAERITFDEFILFQKTKNEKSNFSDKSVERSIRDIRQRLGKYFNDTLPTKLNSVVTEMDDNKK